MRQSLLPRRSSKSAYPMNPDTIITRFAPSPTGFLHAGNYRTAIFAYLCAKRSPRGTFILRIEDTDKERSKKEYEDNIIETLAWLGITPDQMFRQSEHSGRHRELLEKLIAEGHAYRSAETPTEENRRSEVIRFRNPNIPVTFTDVIRGPITMDTTDLGDFVIARSIDEPVFHFAVVVDDADEGISHVIRGEDHISNTPRQILIQRALGVPTPVYAHLPLVFGPDRTKLSKRRGAKALTEYRDLGYLPEALINYLALLGWHPENNQELFSLEELLQVFNLSRIQKSSGIFDETKLLWYNAEHLKRLSSEAFETVLRDYLQREGSSVPEYLEKIIPLLQERSTTLKEAADALGNGEFSFFKEAPITPELLIKGAKTDAETAKRHLAHLETLLIDIPESAWGAGFLKEQLFGYADQEGRGAVLWPLRTALSGKERSPDPFTLLALLGKQESLARIGKAITALV